ncbi:hypothetical protein [Sporichthya polymorpha]|uniref:hypothetical protein n=1 Tax=Sporichthya polymorpha TaxID=35751 RepID=UPI00036F9EAA|nr:hypothetical protein [Sporichthya polymorpha]
MGLLKRLLGLEPDVPAQRSGSTSADDQAIERYRYLLRTAPPETVEDAHAEAFAALTPDQRRQVLAELTTVTPEHERPTSDDPDTLARAATRAEMRQPGTLERTFGGLGTGGLGTGGLMAGSLLAGIAGAYVGTSIAAAMSGDPTGSEMDAAQEGGIDWSGPSEGHSWGGGFDGGSFDGGGSF